MRKIFAALAVLFALSAPACAQFNEAGSAPQAIGGPIASPTFVVPPAQSSGIISISQPFANWLKPWIDALVNSLIIALVGWLATWAHTHLNINLDQKQRDALTAALQNQAGSLIADGMVKIEGEKISVPSEAMAKSVNDLMAAVPSAAAHFGITPEFVADRIVDTIPQIAAGAQLIAKKAETKLP